ncbi:MAG: hypothetical protein QOG15_3007 [Solirubrobacteraceae bacterium]|jgi:hypothetical protein|nr:hypothetical protein [Solirubrobacteraceae bacterium]
MARDKKPVPGEKLTGNAAFEAVTKQVAERNEAAFKAARKLREVADAKMFAERRKRDLA